MQNTWTMIIMQQTSDRPFIYNCLFQDTMETTSSWSIIHYIHCIMHYIHGLSHQYKIYYQTQMCLVMHSVTSVRICVCLSCSCSFF